MKLYLRAIAIGLGASVLTAMLFFGFLVPPIPVFLASVGPYVLVCLLLAAVSHRLRDHSVLRHIAAILSGYLAVFVAIGLVLPVLEAFSGGFERMRMQGYLEFALSRALFYLPVSYFATYVTLVPSVRHDATNVA